MRRAARTIALFVLAFGRPLLAHGDIDEQIAILSRRIAKTPADARLYLHRGELHRFHGDARAALADLARAEKRDPKLAAVHLCRGALFLDAGDPRRARRALGRFLRKEPSNPEGLKLLAKALAKLGRSREAAGLLARAIAASRQPGPELFAEKARLLGESGDREGALAAIDDGLGRLGPVTALELSAIDLAAGLGRADDALGRLDVAAASSPRQEGWLYRRGELLAAAGRGAEARLAYEDALRAIQALPEERRGTPAVWELEERVCSRLTGAHP